MKNVLVNGKWNIILPDHRAARPEWTSEKGWEKARLDSMFETTKKGDNVFYVGAEEGDMCGLLSMWGAELFMFEPNPLVWPNVKAIWEANKLSVPRLAFPGFASSKTDYFEELQPGFPDSANGPMISDHGFKNLCEADGTIPQIRIDDVVKRMGEIPDMITMDTEGADWEVLKGAEKTLKEYKPRLYVSLHPEFMYEIYKVYGNDFRNWIKSFGYKETLLDYQHEVHLLYEPI